MDKKNFAFGKRNYILMAISIIIVIFGFVLMSGGQSTNETFDPSIFNARRIKVAPVICFAGYILMIFAILYKPKGKSSEETESNETVVESTLAEDEK